MTLRGIVTFVAVMGMAGGVPSAHTAGTTFPGANGKLVFQRTESPCWFDQNGIDCHRSLWVSALDGTGARRITGRPRDRRLDASRPQWSPDGRRIAFLWSTGGRRRFPELWVMNADGTAKRKILSLAAQGRAYGLHTDDFSASWSRDGKWLLAEGTAGNSLRSAIQAISATGDGARLVYVSGSRASIHYPTWSPRGGRIAFLTGSWPSSLVVAAADGTRRRTIARAYRGEGGRPFDWAPDGRRLVFLRQPKSGGYGDIYIVNTDGTGLRRVIGNADTCGQGVHRPIWSPDGKSILFETSCVAGTEVPGGVSDRFAIVGVDGSGLRFAGPGSQGCRALIKGPEAAEGPQSVPCRAAEPSWRPR